MKRRVERYVVGVVLACAFVVGAMQPTHGLTVTTSLPNPITIPGMGSSGPAAPYPTSVTYGSFRGVVKAVRVQLLGFSHTFPDDVDVVLVGPGGQTAIIMSDVGGSADITNLNLTLRDDTPAALPDDGPLVSGTFRPTNVGSGDTFVAPGPGAPANQFATLTEAFGGISPVGTWNLYVVDDVGEDMGAFNGGWALTIVTAPPVLDTDPDAITDYTVVRDGPIGITWFTLSGAGFSAVPWGSGGDRFLSGNWDIDAKSDLVVWRPGSATFFVRRSSNGTLLAQPWGLPTDDPVPADYNGDGITDFAVWRPSDGTWYYRSSINAALVSQPWGQAGDKVVPGDYDADGEADFAIRRNTGGSNMFHILQSTAGYTAIPWGFFSDQSVPGDYDGDGHTDVAVVRDVFGTYYWFAQRSLEGGFIVMAFGLATDVAVPADYDGDGETDIAVWRPSSGTFFIRKSTTSSLLVQPFGQSGDYPVANFIVR